VLIECSRATVSFVSVIVLINYSRCFRFLSKEKFLVPKTL
jgi:hypothetical protein